MPPHRAVELCILSLQFKPFFLGSGSKVSALLALTCAAGMEGLKLGGEKSQCWCAGSIEIALPDGKLKRIGITRAHLEEDAGESCRKQQF